MSDQSLALMSLHELAERLRDRHVSAVEVVEAQLERIATWQPKINAFITLLPDQALKAARRAEKAIGAGRYRGPLHGIPYGLKDLYWTKGIRTTSGSTLHSDFLPAEDSTAAAKLDKAGAVLMGKLSTVEFAFGAKEHNPAYGNACNPWNPERISGGSSTGAGGAVAARLLPLAMGSDTAGSVRQPGALSGVVGYKPTFGLISRYGITPISWSLDHAGPLTRTVHDVALAMNALVGRDRRDPATVKPPVKDYTDGIDGGIRGLRVGVPWDFINEVLDADVEAAFHASVRLLTSLGATVKEISVPEFKYSGALLMAIAGPEAVTIHERDFRERAREYHPVIRRRIEATRFISAATYVKAQRVRRLLGIKLAEHFSQIDLMVLPSVGTTAGAHDADTIAVRGTTWPEQEVNTRNLRIFDMNGLPAISIPGGFSRDGLPIGLQLAGRPFEDALVLRAAHAIQRETDWHQRVPEL